MARNVLDGTGWLVEQRDSNVVKAFKRTSVVEAEFRTINMTANTVEIPRIEDMDVEFIAKGAAYPEDQSSADVMQITARKIGGALRIAEEDVEDDKLANYLDLKKDSAGSSFAKKVDNAALGTTAAASGVTVPFTSVYRALTTEDATTDYVANANHRSVETSDLGIDDVEGLLGIIEDGDYFNDDDLVWIAHPSFRNRFRSSASFKDTTGRSYLFTDLTTGGKRIDRILDIPIRYTRGAKTSATPQTNPGGAGGAKGAAGNPLLFLIQKNAAVFGVRKRFESVLIPGRDGTSALTDEDILKVRARIAAGVTIPGAHAVLEVIADA